METCWAFIPPTATISYSCFQTRCGDYTVLFCCDSYDLTFFSPWPQCNCFRLRSSTYFARLKYQLAYFCGAVYIPNSFLSLRCGHHKFISKSCVFGPGSPSKPCVLKTDIFKSPVSLSQAIFWLKSWTKLCQAWYLKSSCVSIMSQALKILLLHMVRSPHCVALVWFRLGPCACLLLFANWLTVPDDTRTAMFASFS